MNFVKATTFSTRLIQKRGISGLKTQVGNKSLRQNRFYSASSHVVVKESSNVPWVVGSLLVFGPLLFKLTSPPEKKKVQPVAPVVIAQKEEEEEEEVPVAVKKVQKPYVLVGAGTASFAAAQAIKEKDPQANVSKDIDTMGNMYIILVDRLLLLAMKVIHLI